MGGDGILYTDLHVVQAILRVLPSSQNSGVGKKGGALEDRVTAPACWSMSKSWPRGIVGRRVIGNTFDEVTLAVKETLCRKTGQAQPLAVA